MAEFEVAELFARIGADLSGLEGGLLKAGDMLTSAGARMGRLGSQLSTSLTLPLSLVGGAAFKAAMDLDTSMRNIQSISKATDDEIAVLQDRFIDISTDITQTTDSANNLAKGFYDIQSSGFAGEDGMQVLLDASKAATAGLSSTAIAAKAITAKLNAYGEAADQAGSTSDLMFKTVDRGVGTFEELAGSLSNVLPAAANAGIKFEEVAAGIATLSKQGLSFSESTVSLNQAILGIIDPSDELLDVFKDLGYASGQAALSSLGFSGTLDLLVQAGYDTTEEMAALFGNVRALRGVLGLTGRGAQLFAEDMEAMGDAAGATQAAFEIQSQSLANQIANLKNEAVALGIGLIEILVPAIQDGIKVAKDLLREFRELPIETQENIVKLALLAAAAGPAFKALSLGITAMKGLGAASMALAGGLMGLPALIADVSAGFALLVEGQSVFAVMGMGAGGLVAALIPIGAVVAGIALNIAKLKQIGDQVEAGAAETKDAWGDFFEKQSASGASAMQVLEAYRSKQAEVAQILEEGGLAVDLFVRDQEALMGNTELLNWALIEASDTYAEYEQAAIAAGLASQMAGKEAFESQKGLKAAADANQEHAAQILEASDSFEAYAQAMWDAGMGLMAVREEQWLAAKASQAMEDALAGVTEETEAMAEEVFDAEKALDILQERLDLAGGTLAGAGSALDQFALSLGAVSQEELDLERDLTLLSDAFAYGVFDVQTMDYYLRQAADGTLQISDAQRDALGVLIELNREMRAGSAAAEELAVKNLSLAEALKGASQAEIAKTAIQELTAAYEAGALSFPDYRSAVMQVQDAYGLVTPASRALAEGMTELHQALLSGTVPAANYDEALKALTADSQDGATNLPGIIEAIGAINAAMAEGTLPANLYDDALNALVQDAADGSINLEGLLKWFGLAPGEIQAAIEAVQGFGTTISEQDWTAAGETITAGLTGPISDDPVAAQIAAAGLAANLMAAAAEEAQSYKDIGSQINADIGAGLEESTSLLDAAGRSTDHITTPFREYDWQSVGTAADQGIAAGITASTPVIAAAAREAALAALAAAEAALGVQSPSKEFARLGKMSTAGFAQGMLDSRESAARAAAGAMNAGLQGAENGGGAPAAMAQNIEVNFYINDQGSMALGLAYVDSLRTQKLNQGMGVR